MRAEIISVVGGGWSFASVDHNAVPGEIIAINEAGLLLETPVKATVTMDRLWTEGRWEQLCSRRKRTHIRRSALQNIDWMTKPWAHMFECDHTSVEFSEEIDRLNGTNSGTCGLNLAYIMRPKFLYVFGFDMCRSPSDKAYWYPPYPWAPPQGATKASKYNTWAAEFNQIALAFASIGTKVVNVSEHSKIACWPRVSAKELGVAK